MYADISKLFKDLSENMYLKTSISRILKEYKFQ